MYIGIRDIWFARGRFALISGVIALMSLMVVALSALTGGLGDQSVSAVKRLPGKTVVVQQPAEGQKASLTESALSDDQLGALLAGGGSPWGITTTRLTTADSSGAVTVFGTDEQLVPAANQGHAPGAGEVLLGTDQADELGVAVGETVGVGGEQLTVAGIGDAGYFAHTDVAYTDTRTFARVSRDQPIGAVVLDRSAPEVAGTEALAMDEVTDAVPGYSSEHGSLLAMQALLVVISALVVGSFFTVWAQQRRRDLAVLSAMGADRTYLLRDGLGQAAVVLAVGLGVGVAGGLGLAAAASSVVPIAISASAVLIPVAGMTVLGLLGAAGAVIKVARVDPLIALGA